MNSYLIGLLIQDAKTILSQLDFYQRQQSLAEKPLDKEITKDLIDKLTEINIELQTATQGE